MNAPAEIRLDENSHEAALRSAIAIHCPNQTEFEMACRVDIAIMRDQASAGIFRARPAASALLAQVASVGSAAVYAPASLARLMKARVALRMTIDAARALERAGVDG